MGTTDQGQLVHQKQVNCPMVFRSEPREKIFLPVHRWISWSLGNKGRKGTSKQEYAHLSNYWGALGVSWDCHQEEWPWSWELSTKEHAGHSSALKQTDR